MPGRLALVFLLVLGEGTGAAAAVVDFDGLSDTELVTTQFAGVTFANAVIASAGGTLDALEFPPRSGPNVVVDDGAPISLVFETLQRSVGGFATYGTLLTLIALDDSDSVVASEVSAFSSNMALSGEPGSSPSEFLGVTSTPGIRRVIFEGGQFGDSFVLDDLTFSVALPSTLLLLGAGVAAVAPRAFRRGGPRGGAGAV